MTGRTAGRKGAAYRRARAQVLATSTICGICGHSGARTADHVIPRSVCLMNGWLHLLNNPANMRPAHGSGNPCPTCRQHCNQVRGNEQRKRKPDGKSRVW